jgi:macrolide-specific efflux system membrane fusion protein
MKLKILAIVALAAVGLGAAFVAVGGLPASAAASTQYLTSAAATGDVTSSVAATGSLASTASYGLAFGTAAHLAGASPSGASTTWDVTKVKVKVGDLVKAGDIVAVAGSSDLRRQIDDALTTWRVAKIQLANAQDAFDNASGTSAVRQAQIGLYNAQAQVSNAQATRETLQAQLKDAVLTAPIDGVVTAVNLTVGLEAPAGDAIVIDSSGLQVTADVVESDVPQMTVGQSATVTISAVGADLTGTVVAIAPGATTGSTSGGVVSYPVTISIQGAPATVRPGMTASITITIDSATGVLTVPAAALRGTAGSYTVLVMGTDAQSAAQPVSTPVQVGLVTNTTAEIKSGLSAGEVVVTGINTPQTGTATTTGGGLNGGFGGFGGGTGRPRNGN